MIFETTVVDDSNRDVFIAALSDEVRDEADLILGLYEIESDTACGVLAARGISDAGEENFALGVMEMVIHEDYDSPQSRSTLLRGLQDLAAESGFTAVYYSEFIDAKDSDNISKTLTDIGFYREEKELPLYEFSIRDIKAGNPESDMGCLTIDQLSDLQWEAFKEDASGYSFEIADRAYYDPKTSTFLVDEDGNIQAGLLTSLRMGDLYIEGVAAYGGDERALINDLIFWGCSSAKKSLSLGANVYIYMFTDRIYNKFLMDATQGKAARIGSLVNFTYSL